MKPLDPQAVQLNDQIKKDNPAAFGLLSARGRAIFFPNLGIVSQSAAAKGKRIDATIGIAIEDDATPMRFRAIADRIQVDPRDSFTYASSYGKPELRIKWQEMIRSKNPSLKTPISLPVVTHALTHGLSMAGYMFVDSGDKILLPDKYWENYELLFELAYGGELTFFNTFRNSRSTWTHSKRVSLPGIENRSTDVSEQSHGLHPDRIRAGRHRFDADTGGGKGEPGSRPRGRRLFRARVRG
jgi:hypothetical protein